MDKKEDYSVITHIIVKFINNIYKISSHGYEILPLLLIITSIIFVFLYTYHSLYRVNRKLFFDWVYNKRKNSILGMDTREFKKYISREINKKN
jgi:hypothetical protein